MTAAADNMNDSWSVKLCYNKHNANFSTDTNREMNLKKFRTATHEIGNNDFLNINDSHSWKKNQFAGWFSTLSKLKWIN